MSEEKHRGARELDHKVGMYQTAFLLPSLGRNLLKPEKRIAVELAEMMNWVDASCEEIKYVRVSLEIYTRID